MTSFPYKNGDLIWIQISLPKPSSHCGTCFQIKWALMAPDPFWATLGVNSLRESFKIWIWLNWYHMPEHLVLSQKILIPGGKEISIDFFKIMKRYCKTSEIKRYRCRIFRFRCFPGKLNRINQILSWKRLLESYTITSMIILCYGWYGDLQ